MTRKKLIEVALPLDEINAASAREKSIRHGHPSTLHLWWSRKPLATARAVLFASIVDDPSSDPERFPTEEMQDAERERLFGIIREMVLWENTTDEDVWRRVRAEIRKATGDNPPPVLDPFCGGGSILLEAQRLGLEAHGSDLNPVAVLITKALIEIPPKFAGQPPVNPEAQKKIGSSSNWRGAQGLAADVRYYGQWMREEAKRRIGNLYPTVTLPKDQGGGEATVIAWLWARTVTCPNPACGARMPLASSFWLSKKVGNQAWVVPDTDRTQTPPIVRFTVKGGNGVPPDPPKTGRGANFRCLCCGQVIGEQYIKSEGMAGRMGAQMMAVVAEGRGGRIYLAPNKEHEVVAASAQPTWRLTEELAFDPRNIWCVNYGLMTFADLFTSRQTVALTTFSDLVSLARQKVQEDARDAVLTDDARMDSAGIPAYADAIATYLALSLSKAADLASNLCHWQSNSSHLKIAPAFMRPALSMSWDYAEGNPFSDSSGNFHRQHELVAEVLDAWGGRNDAEVCNADATKFSTVRPILISTDPPYYDNIAYSVLSDYFYVWLRGMLGEVYPDLFRTLLTPKSSELVADSYRQGNREEASRFFESGLKAAFSRMRLAQHPDYPLTVYYAYKQSESDEEPSGDGVAGIASTGWETMLAGLLQAGFQITGTWPMRTERSARPRQQDSNALASSIVLVCRPRSSSAGEVTRRELISAMRDELPGALRHLQHGNIAPVDLAQAAIGPGMAVFSRYRTVLEANGQPMRVRTALQLINQMLDEVLAEQESEYDADTRWAVAWHAQYGTDEGPYGDAETLSKAKNASIQGLVKAGIVQARAGKVRLLKRNEFADDWTPNTDTRCTLWEVTQHLIRALDKEGEDAAAALLVATGEQGEMARDLAYRLYTICERKGWTDEARMYNMLVVAWGGITGQAQEQRNSTPQMEQSRLV